MTLSLVKNIKIAKLVTNFIHCCHGSNKAQYQQAQWEEANPYSQAP